MNHVTDTILEKATRIKALAFDVDGVLTDGKIYFTDEGIEYKAFNAQDGLGLKMLIKAGLEVAIITARQSKLVEIRMNELGVKHIYQGQENKLIAFEHLKTKLNLVDEQIAYTGDDLNDIGPIRRSGLGIAVANASPFVQRYADYITTRQGGAGAAREIAELVLSAQALLEPLCEQYL